MFPRYKIDEQQNKRLKKGHFPKRRESEDKDVVAIVKSVSQLGCVSQDSDAIISQGTKEFRGDPMPKVLNEIRKVRFTKSTLRQASVWEKKRTIVGKNKSRSSSAKSLRSKIRGSVPRGDWTTTAMCPMQGLGSRQKKIMCHNLPTYKEVDSPKCRIKSVVREEFVVYSGASMHTVSEKRL